MCQVMLPWVGGGFGQLRGWRIPAAFAIVQLLALGLGSLLPIYIRRTLEYDDSIKTTNLQSTLDMEELALEAEQQR